MVVMLVAIFLVHLPHGFSAASNGFEIPFYYLLFLIVLATHGAGKISTDYFVFSKKE
jgi:putative oxidoreductase